MKKNILYLGLSCLILAALVLSSCSGGSKTTATVTSTSTATQTNTSTTTKTTTTSASVTTSSTASNEPVYGGIFTYYLFGGNVTDADMTDGYWPTVMYTNPIIEYPMKGDFEKYGPRGTGESDFVTEQAIPEKFLTGALAQSWDVTATSITLHVQKGIQWPALAGVMAQREYVASDMAFNMNRFMDCPAVGGNRTVGSGPMWTKNGGFVDSIIATDNYTVVVKTSRFNADWINVLAKSYGSGHYAPETVAKDPTKWENLNGTGPFMYENYVADSFMSYKPNAVYYGKATINGKQYSIPFIKELIMPIIPEMSSQLASLRTGKLDCTQALGLQYETTLASSTPQLVKHTWLHSIDLVMALNMKNKPLDNLKVRQALMMALDLSAINTTINIKGDYTCYPADPQSGPDIFTPLNQLPADTAATFKYDATAAKKLMTDAGYPNGFPLSIAIRTEPSTASFTNAAQLMAGMWKDNLGVTLTLNALDPVAFSNMMNSHTGYDVSTQTILHTDVLKSLSMQFLPGDPNNYANYSDPTFTAAFQAAAATTDTAARNAQLKKLCVQVLGQTAYIPIGAADFTTYWWPWVRNYYGEYETACYTPGYWQAEVWIDQNMKKSMGY